MGLFSKKQEYTQKTIGTIVGVSAVQVNKMHLPIAEYEINGIKYKVRVPYDIAIKLERESTDKSKMVRANLNVGISDIHMQITKIQGAKVTIVYDPNNPKKSKVIS